MKTKVGAQADAVCGAAVHGLQPRVGAQNLTVALYSSLKGQHSDRDSASTESATQTRSLDNDDRINTYTAYETPENLQHSW